LYQRGNFKAALQEVGPLLRQFPREPQALNMSAGVYAALKDNLAAEKLLRKAVKLDPKNHEYLRNLATMLRDTRRPEEALPFVIKCVKLRPDFANGWNSLGLVYMDLEDSVKARKAYLKALRINPDMTEAAANFLSENESRNDIEELRSTLEDLGQSFGDKNLLTMFKGVLAYREKSYAEAKDLLLAADFGPKSKTPIGTLESLRINRLAMIEDRLGDYPEAFEHFLLANRLAVANTPRNNFDPRRFVQRIEERVDYYEFDQHKSWKPIATSDAAPVLMVGFPRSGTTLLDTFLRGHKDISVTEELPMMDRALAVLGTTVNGNLDRLENPDRKTVQKVISTYIRELDKNSEPKPIKVDRMPLHNVLTGEVLRFFPKARFIVAMRDPADVVFSSFMQNFTLGDATATMTTPLSTARIYDKVFSLWQLYLEKFDVDYTVVRYEDIVADKEASLRKLVEYLGVEWDPAMVDHQKTAAKRGKIHTASYAQVVQPIYKTALKRWEHYADMMPEALEILKPWRAAYAYE